MKFNKPALSVIEQINLLNKRGMAFENPKSAEQFLTHVNYYRLRAYWMPFENDDTANFHSFKAGTKFGEVLKLYNFDQQLRILVMTAVERIEVSVRTRLANYLSIAYGPFAHTDEKNFVDKFKWDSCLTELNKEYQRSHETFAKHNREQYSDLAYPPIWVACELMSLGHLSRWFSNLKLPKDRQEIARYYGIDEKVLASFLHHLTIVRNYCAHHARLWNRKLSVRMTLPNKKPSGAFASFNNAKPQCLYNTLTMLVYLNKCISSDHCWREKIILLLDQATPTMLTAMGFTENWRQVPYWKD